MLLNMNLIDGKCLLFIGHFIGVSNMFTWNIMLFCKNIQSSTSPKSLITHYSLQTAINNSNLNLSLSPQKHNLSSASCCVDAHFFGGEAAAVLPKAYVVAALGFHHYGEPSVAGVYRKIGAFFCVVFHHSNLVADGVAVFVDGTAFENYHAFRPCLRVQFELKNVHAAPARIAV